MIEALCLPDSASQAKRRIAAEPGGREGSWDGAVQPVLDLRITEWFGLKGKLKMPGSVLYPEITEEENSHMTLFLLSSM